MANSFARFPLISWQNANGMYTVSTVSGASVSAVDLDESRCHSKIKKYLRWKYEQRQYDFQPEFEEPQLEYHEVAVRPGYGANGRFYPAEEMIRLKIPLVYGERFDDSIVCVLPTLGTSFHCRKKELIKSLVDDHVRKQIGGKSPEEISLYLCPPNIKVDRITVRLKEKETQSSNAELPTLESVAIPLARRSTRKQFKEAIERDAEIQRLCDSLQETHGNILLLGNRGVGKTTLLVNAIRNLERIEKASKQESSASEQANSRVADRYWMTSGDRIISGMQYLGQWEERAELIIAELSMVQGTLCCENLHQLIRLGGRGAEDSIANFFAPFMQNNELRLIVEADQIELETCRRLIPSFESLFQIVEVKDFERESAKRVLERIATQAKRNRKIEFDVEASELAYRFFKRFMPYDHFPGKCVKFWRDLFDEQFNDKSSVEKRVTAQQVVKNFVKQTGLPEMLLRDELTITPEEINGHFKSRIIGQNEACESVTRIITTLKAGLNDPNRPIGVQLFCGPTGVGKTEMAKALAAFMFGSEEQESDSKGQQTESHASTADRMVRLDMSEYAGYGAAERLLMQPDGKPSKLIQSIREQPFSVILLDEVEKAASEVFDVLMGMFDEGRLTDRWGRTTDFRSTIIVMTSNLGVKKSAPIGFESAERNLFEKEVRQFFRPEFYNRFDAVIPFQPLSQESIREISTLELKKIAKRDGLKNRNLELTWSDALIEHVSKEGFNERLGARPLQRTIETLVVTPIAQLLSTNPTMGNATIHVDFLADNGIVLTND